MDPDPDPDRDARPAEYAHPEARVTVPGVVSVPWARATRERPGEVSAR